MSAITEKPKKCLWFLNLITCCRCRSRSSDSVTDKVNSKYMCIRKCTLIKEDPEENTINCISSTSSVISPSVSTKTVVLENSENQDPSSLVVREPETLSYVPGVTLNSVSS